MNKKNICRYCIYSSFHFELSSKLVKYGSVLRWKMGCKKSGASQKVWHKIMTDKLDFKKARLKGSISEQTKDEVEDFLLTHVFRSLPLKKIVLKSGMSPARMYLHECI